MAEILLGVRVLQTRNGRVHQGLNRDDDSREQLIVASVGEDVQQIWHQLLEEDVAGPYEPTTGQAPAQPSSPGWLALMKPVAAYG